MKAPLSVAISLSYLPKPWPPPISAGSCCPRVCKVYTHQPVADIGAFAPRAYSEDAKETPADRWNHVRDERAESHL